METKWYQATVFKFIIDAIPTERRCGRAALKSNMASKEPAKRGTSSPVERVVMLSYEYPPVPGGISNFCRDLVKSFSLSSGEPVALVTSVEGEGRDERARFYHVPKKRPWREIASLFFLSRNLGQVFLASIWYPEGLIAAVRGVRPFILLAHGLELLPYATGWRKVFWGPLRRWVFSRATLVLANSRYSANLVKNICPGAKVEVLCLAVDTHRFVPASDADRNQLRIRLGVQNKWVLSSLSRLVHYKGYRTVFEALSYLSAEQRKQIVYRIGGTGPDEKALKEEAKRWGMADLITWVGWVDEKNLREFYQCSDLFVLCSYEDPKRREVEGFGIVYLEAQACGVPVIGTLTGGVSDAVEEGNGGWLIGAQDAKALSARIGALMDHPDELRACGLNARARVEAKFSEERFQKDVQRFVGNVVITR